MSGEMNNGNNSPYMAHPLIVSAHVSLQSPLCGLLSRGFWVLVNDFSGVRSQLGSGHHLGYVLQLNYLVRIKAVSTSKWSLFESSHIIYVSLFESSHIIYV